MELQFVDSLRSWRYCVDARLNFGGGAVFQKKGVGTRRLISRGFATRDGSDVKSHSTILQRAPPPNLTRLLHNTASYAGYVKPGVAKKIYSVKVQNDTCTV